MQVFGLVYIISLLYFQIAQYECACVDGYSGPMCEDDVNECLSSPCLNGAECRDLIGKYECNCLPGFTGMVKTRLYFFVTAQIAQVAQPVLFKCTGQLGPCGQK